jgi:hypothetical protein
MSNQLENQQSIENQNKNTEQEIFTHEKGKETLHSNISPQIQKVLDDIQYVPIEYLSLIKEFNWKQIKEMMYVLSNCTCCKRHQKDRPSVWNLENGHNGYYDLSDIRVGEHACRCPCRHEAREFCKIINDPHYFEAQKELYINEEDYDTETRFKEDYDTDTETRFICMDCGEDMGPYNPRQLCGKTYCKNIREIDDNGSIS